MTRVGIASSCRGLDNSPTPFKFVEVLTALGRPDAALAVLRARAPVSQASKLSCNQAFQEAQTALAVRLQCGVFTEACFEVGMATYHAVLALEFACFWLSALKWNQLDLLCCNGASAYFLVASST